MIKGLAITPPVLGRISIGRVVEKSGKRLPEKDDQFTITTQVQTKDGWLLHPLDEELRKTAPNGKLRAIPVRMLFSEPDLNLRASYSLFDRQNGRPICVGNGETCRRVTADGIQSLHCLGPESCAFSNGGCKAFGRLHVRIGDADELGTFIFRTTGFNSIRTLAARLSYLQAVSGNLLPYLPLELRLRGKSTTQSHRMPIYYVDLTLMDGQSLSEAVKKAGTLAAHHREAGFDQGALDKSARAGYGNATFEESEEEVGDFLDEFNPESAVDDSTPPNLAPRLSLAQRLDQKRAGG